MNTDTFQDTVEKEVDSDSEKSLMFDYLTGNSTGMETKGTKISAIGNIWLILRAKCI